MTPFDDDKLNTMLARASYVSPPSEPLAARILAAARHVEQKRPVRFGAWLNSLFGEFYGLRPAYALVGLLAIGFVLGVSADNTVGENTTTTADFLYDDGDML